MTDSERNRRRYTDDNESVTVLTAAMAMQRGNDSSYFKQESNFFWLTGINEPDWWAVIEPSGKTWLVRPNISKTHQIFDGSLNDQEALKISGADGVLSRVQAMEKLKVLATKYPTVQTLGPHPRRKQFDFALNPAAARLRNLLKKVFQNVEDCRLPLAKLRAIKQPYEIESIQKAIDLTIDGFQFVHQQLSKKLVKTEYEIEAEFSYLFKKAGNSNHSYDPIVAGGKNACTLHYNKNQNKLSDGLVLMDIGAEVDGYAADITRTFAFGKTTDRERQVHAAVEKAHHDIIALLRPGLSIEIYQQKVDEIMHHALSSLGLLHKSSDYRHYFPHAISHGLGLDVHDSLGMPETFQLGMVLTVEPGIYIPEEGIGVRIEDDILITETSYKNLSGRLSTGL
jgi:Xaa-Pro aminopeptidase